MSGAPSSRSPIGVLLGWIAKIWLWTLRVRFVGSPAYLAALTDSARSPLVFAFFHGTQFSLLAWPRPRKTTVLVSHSKDGALQASALGVQGFAVVRGSSSRGGARGLRELVATLRNGNDAAFAVDGPRGPYGVAKAGAVIAARSASARLVPLGVACMQAIVLEKAWDRFLLPLPFSRVIVCATDPLEPSLSAVELGAAIDAANRGAAALASVGARHGSLTTPTNDALS